MKRLKYFLISVIIFLLIINGLNSLAQTQENIKTSPTIEDNNQNSFSKNNFFLEMGGVAVAYSLNYERRFGNPSFSTGFRIGTSIYTNDK